VGKMVNKQRIDNTGKPHKCARLHSALSDILGHAVTGALPAKHVPLVGGV
jgi:hypothetical protein